MCAAVTVELDRYGCCGDNADDGIIHCRTGICLEPNFVMCAAVSSTGTKSPLHSTPRSMADMMGTGISLSIKSL